MDNYEIFISHSSEDKQIANAVCHIMEENGIRCWIAPRDVCPGKSYPSEIQKGITESRLMVLIFSKNSNKSPQVLNEIDRAFSQGKPIIPFVVDETKMNVDLDYYLCRAHWLTAFPNYREQLGDLVETAIKYLGIRPTNSCKKSEAKKERNSVEVMPQNKASEERNREEEKKQAESWWEIGDKYYEANDYAQAVNWFQKAAEQGEAEAQFRLGRCYEGGLGVAKDYNKAIFWYDKAVAQNHMLAKDILLKLKFMSGRLFS